MTATHRPAAAVEAGWMEVRYWPDMSSYSYSHTQSDENIVCVSVNNQIIRNIATVKLVYLVHAADTSNQRITHLVQPAFPQRLSPDIVETSVRLNIFFATGLWSQNKMKKLEMLNASLTSPSFSVDGVGLWERLAPPVSSPAPPVATDLCYKDCENGIEWK